MFPPCFFDHPVVINSNRMPKGQPKKAHIPQRTVFLRCSVRNSVGTGHCYLTLPEEISVLPSTSTILITIGRDANGKVDSKTIMERDSPDLFIEGTLSFSLHQILEFTI